MRQSGGLGFFVSVMVLGSVAVQAQQSPRPVCMDTASTQLGMNACAAQVLHWSEDRLRTLLAALADTSQTDGLTPLTSAQTAWQSFRDAQCAWSRDQFQGGTIAPMVHTLCLADLTERRIDELKGFLCAPGGGTCAASREYDVKADSQ